MPSNWRRRPALNFGGLPALGLAASALRPPASAACRHRPTDTTDVLNTLATAAGFMPRPSMATA
jgi:hypothetical protein